MASRLYYVALKISKKISSAEAKGSRLGVWVEFVWRTLVALLSGSLAWILVRILWIWDISSNRAWHYKRFSSRWNYIVKASFNFSELQLQSLPVHLWTCLPRMDSEKKNPLEVHVICLLGMMELMSNIPSDFLSYRRQPALFFSCPLLYNLVVATCLYILKDTFCWWSP